jgi:hypothetical protein
VIKLWQHNVNSIRKKQKKQKFPICKFRKITPISEDMHFQPTVKLLKSLQRMGINIWNFYYVIFIPVITLCCHNFIQNDIHDLMTFITNKQNTKRIWVGPFQFNLIKCLVLFL